jgi:hypothetical protein
VRSIATTGEQELAEFRPMSIRYSSTAERVWSVSSNRAGLPVFFCLMVARRVLNESLFFGIGHAHSAIAAWVADYITATQHRPTSPGSSPQSALTLRQTIAPRQRRLLTTRHTE